MGSSITWPERTEPPPLQSAQVHLWACSLGATSQQIEKYKHYLDASEQARANRYAFEEAANRYIIGRARLKELLTRYTGGDPARLKFQLGHLGKPYLPSPISPAIQFNSTDTLGTAVFAVCRDYEVGVDIEHLARRVNHQVIAKRKFTLAEQDQYNQCAVGKRKEFFLSLWTRKEAFGKAKGVGIRYRLNQITLIDDDCSDWVAVEDEGGKMWSLQVVNVPGNLIACVAVEGETRRLLRCFTLGTQ